MLTENPSSEESNLPYEDVALGAAANDEKAIAARPTEGDLEDGVGDGDFGEIHAVKQGLHQRHIQMIALAGTIGTGLFLGSGRAIARAGPLGAFLGYSISKLTTVLLAM